ncbi:MAG: glycosyltransferase, partial [Candidatus Altiarchaeales archaeon]|nr:glycosyltransferase [Candidatus Altiarchaeales archaeon]
VLSYDYKHFIANSHYTKNNLINAGIDSKRISVIHNGVDLEGLKQVSSPKKEKPTITTVSRLVEYKNIGDVLDAAKILIKKHPDLRVEVVGSGAEEKNLKKKTRKLGLKDKVVFHGYVESHLDVMRIVKSSHAFVLPSTVEGFGITTIEAIALKVPYAASDIPPIREATGAGRGGLLYPPRDVGGLASCLDRILSGKIKPDPGFAEENYGWDGLAKKTEETYRNLLH